MNIIIIAPATQDRFQLFCALDGLGHRPMAYDNGTKALDFFEHLHERLILPYPVELVILKPALSDMTGPEFIRLATDKGAKSEFLMTDDYFLEGRELTKIIKAALS